MRVGEIDGEGVGETATQPLASTPGFAGEPAKPGAQKEHCDGDVLAAEDVVVPAGQAEQLLAFVVVENVPASHGTQG